MKTFERLFLANQAVDRGRGKSIIPRRLRGLENGLYPNKKEEPSWGDNRTFMAQVAGTSRLNMRDTSIISTRENCAIKRQVVK